MPNFDIFLQGCYDEVQVFRPFDGWDEHCEEEPEENEEQAMIRKLIALRNDNRKLFLELTDDLHGMQFEGIAIHWHPEVDLRVDFYKGMSIIESKYFDKYEVKSNCKQSLELDELALEAIKNCIRGEFCVVRVWENTGGGIYESRSPESDKEEFDISKLHYDMGQITYDGVEFSITNGDGMSSRTMIFVDGQKLDAI